ncbi:MAG TPA: enoyl-CoA hydratase/isomerase family protein [Polyangiaceae bacterium]|nr:enoyl-CoA hydratase/isomerase family protein [Polyangiaceae bacterium]
MSYQEIRLVLDGAVAELTLARAESSNAMTEAMGGEIVRAIEAINASAATRVVLVRGEGKNFSSGGAFEMLERRSRDTPDDNRTTMRRFYDSFLSIRDVRVPTIAVLQGAAMGAGLCFALACDLRIAASKTKLGANFVRVGLHPGMGATWLLPRTVGAAAAADLLLTGRTIEAEEGLRLGVINQVHDKEALDLAARALAARIAEGAPLAIAKTKATLLAVDNRTLDEALTEEANAQAADFATNDLKEAIAAFGAKRPPRFGGS